MLTKAQNKYIRSLTQQKYRKEHRVFVAEGVKIAAEWLQSGSNVRLIVAVQEWIDDNTGLISNHPETELVVVKGDELQVISSLKTANKVLLVIEEPGQNDINNIGKEWTLALDDIGDPGNMGTIIRIADWFGIRHLVLSPECVDIYNPKVIQAAMGSHLRINFYTSDLTDFLSTTTLPVFAATLNGENIYTFKSPDAGVLVLGNESRGIKGSLLPLASKGVTIPGKGGAESLNVAVSAGILCALLINGR